MRVFMPPQGREQASPPPCVTGARSDGPLALYDRAGYTVVGQDHDAAGVELAVLEKPARAW